MKLLIVYQLFQIALKQQARTNIFDEVKLHYSVVVRVNAHSGRLQTNAHMFITAASWRAARLWVQ